MVIVLSYIRQPIINSGFQVNDCDKEQVCQPVQLAAYSLRSQYALLRTLQNIKIISLLRTAQEDLVHSMAGSLASSPPASPPMTRPLSAIFQSARSSSQVSVNKKAGGGSRASDDDGKTLVKVGTYGDIRDRQEYILFLLIL